MQIEIKYLHPRESTHHHHRLIITNHSRKSTGDIIKMWDNNRGLEPLITQAQYNRREMDLEQRCRILLIELNIGQSICFDIFGNQIKTKKIYY